MSAAIEAAIEQIPSIGFSLRDFATNADFSHTRELIKNITLQVLNHGIEAGTEANGKWQEEFEKRKDPYGRSYFWMDGYFVNFDEDKNDTDEWALANNYASIVPCQYDITSYSALKTIQQWQF